VAPPQGVAGFRARRGEDIVLTSEGAKSRRTSGFDDAPTPSAFAPLRPFLKSKETDLSRGLENLSAELARLDSQVRLE
jgi:hypothetical protein